MKMVKAENQRMAAKKSMWRKMAIENNGEISNPAKCGGVMSAKSWQSHQKHQ
jgi:hypothetical protein